MASTTRDEISRLELLHAAHPDGLVFPHLADAYRRAGRFSQAETILAYGLQRHADYSAGHVVMGRLRLDQGRHEEAAEAFETVLEIEPDNHVALEYLGRIFLEQDRPEEALARFRRLAELKPSRDVKERVEELERRVRQRQGLDPEPSVTPPSPSDTELVWGGVPDEPGAPVEPGAPETTATESAEPDLVLSWGDAPDLTLDEDDQDEPRPQTPSEGGAAPDSRVRPGEETAAEAPVPAHEPPIPTREPAVPAEEPPVVAWDPAVLPDPPPHREPVTVESVARESDPHSQGLEPGEVMTETMAELYSRQALHRRAAMLYRQLLARNPGDERLRTKLRAAETAAEAAEAAGRAELGVPTVPPAEARPPEPEPPQAPTGPVAEPVPFTAPWEPFAEPEPATPGAAPAGVPSVEPEPVGAGTESEETPARAAVGETQEAAPAEPEPASAQPAGAAEAPEEIPAEPEVAATPGAAHLPPIRDQLQGMLAWRPGAEPDAAPEAEAAGAAEEKLAAEPEQAPRTLIALTDMLVGLLEYRDPALRGRTTLTRLLAENVARELGASPAEQSAVALAALLRNIGQVAEEPEAISAGGTGDPRARRERRLGRTLELLDGTGVPPTVRAAVRHCQERWDGAGYPDGLAGRAIPRLARVLSVADAFAGMISPPAGQPARTVRDASHRLLESSGIVHDPAVVRALIRLLDRRDQPLRTYVDRPRILLIEPGPGAILTTTKLDTAGYRVEVVPDPDEARDRLVRFDPAALVASARAGERSVARLVRDIRADRRFKDLAVVVVDASSVSFRVWLLEHGADVCFPPGTTHAEVAGTLAALVRRGKRSRKRNDAG